VPFTKTPIGYTGDSHPDTVYGIGYDDPNNRFIVTDWNRNVFSVTAAGVSNQLPSTVYYLKGLHVSSDPVPTDVPPVAFNDAATTDEGGPGVEIDVYANDSNPDGGPESIVSLTQPANGTVHTFGAGELEIFYRPDNGYCNDGSPTDDFTYTLNGGSTATVSVTVNCVPFVGPLVFGANDDGNDTSTFSGAFAAFDAGTGRWEYERKVNANVIGSTITGGVFNATGLASDPRDGTLYVTLAMDDVPTDVLATLDPLSGEAITIGETGREIGGLTMGAGGVLYALGGDFDVCDSCLFTIDPTTAKSKMVKELDLANFAAIAFNPVDKRIYRATLGGFEAIDPSSSYRVTDIGYGGSSPSFEVAGLGYDPATGGFILTDHEPSVWRVNPAGGAFRVSDLADDLRGLVVSEPTLSLKYSARKRRFTGKLLTPVALGCDEGRDVSVWRDVTGPDELVGQSTTDVLGSFVLTGRAKRGKYFATVGAAPAVDGFPCPDGRSRTITIR
jgi:hypothetical protein